MAVDFDELIAQMDGAYPGVQYEANEAIADVDRAWVKWSAGDDHLCLNYTLKAVDHLEYGGYDIVGYYMWGANGFDSMIPLAFKYLKGMIDALEPTITMEQILAAMVAATPDDVMDFIGLVDAYRQSVWNRPFDSEFFASMARSFEQWG